MKFDPKPFYRLRPHNKRHVQAGGALWTMSLLAEPRVNTVRLDLHRYGTIDWAPVALQAREELFIPTSGYTVLRPQHAQLLRGMREGMKRRLLALIEHHAPKRLRPNPTDEARRAEFETAMYRRYLWLKDNGWSAPQEGDPTMEALFWRTTDGQYGVQQFEAAWIAWNMACDQRENDF